MNVFTLIKRVWTELAARHAREVAAVEARMAQARAVEQRRQAFEHARAELERFIEEQHARVRAKADEVLHDAPTDGKVH